MPQTQLDAFLTNKKKKIVFLIFLTKDQLPLYNKLCVQKCKKTKMQPIYIDGDPFGVCEEKECPYAKNQILYYVDKENTYYVRILEEKGDEK